jgi:hypothetical protein
MFEHIVLRRTAGGLPISAGQIAEALLYYQKVHIVVDRGTLQNLVRQIGTGHILALLRRAEISAVYCEEILGTYTDSAGVSQYHNYVSMKVAGHETVGKFKNPQERLQYFIEGQGISKRKQRFLPEPFWTWSPLVPFPGITLFRAELLVQQSSTFWMSNIGSRLSAKLLLLFREAMRLVTILSLK